MKFRKFEIRNFKGVSHAVFDLIPAGANVFTLIGLNESGKTTLLEAIDDFGTKSEGTEALYGAAQKRDYASYVPKHRKANFTGSITIKADVELTEDDRDLIIAEIRRETGSEVNKASIPLIISMTREYNFDSSDFKNQSNYWTVSLQGKRKGGRKDKTLSLSDDPEGVSFCNAVRNKLPKIVYFPTFLFAIPEKIILNPDEDKETKVNRLYRQIIQDVASSLSDPLDVDKHIVQRILHKESIQEQMIALMMLAPDKQRQINATLNAMSSHLTRTIQHNWGRVFGGNFGGRQILLRLGIDHVDEANRVYVQMILKDGETEFEISERSLGFRWFFSFLLFTQYRVYARGQEPTLFLLDEPASNLHSKAQTQLLESLGNIASGDNQVVYSTHSHYMINPHWLDQAYVVANDAVDYESADTSLSSGYESRNNVTLDRYRNFVGQNPSKTTYFQPVLDKLDVIPSKLDILKTSVLVEGKGDFFILEYGRRVIEKSKSPVAVVPTRGAAGMDELVGLFLGWGVNFVICLDADKAGMQAQRRYQQEWGLPNERVLTLADIDPILAGKRIEDLLDQTDLDLVKEKIGSTKKLEKGQLQLFFSEALARQETLSVSTAFKKRIKSFEVAVAKALDKK